MSTVIEHYVSHEDYIIIYSIGDEMISQMFDFADANGDNVIELDEVLNNPVSGGGGWGAEINNQLTN